MRKGISAVVVSVLLVLIVVSLASAFLLFSSSSFTRLGETATHSQQRVAAQTSRAFSIDAVGNNVVTLRNSGSMPLNTSGLIFYLDEIMIGHTNTVIPPNSVGTVNVTGTWRFRLGNHILRVSSGGIDNSVAVVIEKPPGNVLDLNFDNPAESPRDLSGYGNNAKLYGDVRLLMHFDEGFSSLALDETGNNNTATLVGAVKAEGLSGQGLIFDGINNYASLSSQIAYADTASFTVSVWYRGNDTDQNGDWGKALIGRANGDIYANLILRNGYVEYLHYNNTWLHNIKSTKFVADNSWHHIVYVNYPNETGELYIDGVKEISGSSSISNDLYPYRIDGFMRGYNNVHTIGTIDEIVVYSKSLTTAEVQNLYNAKKAIFVEYVDGTFGKALSFNGASAYVSIPPTASLALPANDEAVEFWVKYPISGSSSVFFQSAGWSRRLFDAQWVFTDAVSQYYYPSALGSNDGTWHHVSYSIKDRTIRSYVDGVLVSTTTATSDICCTAVSEWWIGRLCGGTSCDNYFSGSIDEVRIYNRAYAPETIYLWRPRCSCWDNENQMV